MAEPQSNAPLRAPTGAPTSGVIHVRTRLTADFTVIANALAQRRGSAVTVGVAAYILSLPDGAPVRIDALCEHFTEGEILISRALRELEADGYLERRRERGPGGVLRTRTYFYDVPGQGDPTPTPPVPPRPRRPTREQPPAPGPRPDAASDAKPEATAPARGPVPPPSPEAAGAPPIPPAPDPEAALLPPLTEPDPKAVVILASLRIRDRRLILSRREVAQLAPAVAQWLAQGAGPEEITDLLTTGLPARLSARPARILAFRLRDLPVAAPAQAAAPDTPPVLPWQTCDGGCERAFRAAEPGRCRDCPPEAGIGTAPVTRHEDAWPTAC
ncbi:hypothetical protein ACFO9E_15485 [Streptomyces maoxianensis]|uniref:DNA-binding protein n=1 Tax=Streptomyces maoxianensis TaxID=1459942 RepID=A0ABV9G4S0_9ACTN